MTNKQSINITSLNLIQDELMVTIGSASTHLEAFINERDNVNVLEACIKSLQQIRGSLDLIQLHGACELAGEILQTASGINGDNTRKLDERLSSLTKGFFILSCYFEYTLQNGVGMPVLLVPYINDIRATNNKPLMSEAFFEKAVLSYRLPVEGDVKLPEESTFLDMIRRFRHMYQVGLLGFFREVRLEPSLKLMLRAAEKIHKLSKNTASETLWWLVREMLMAFIEAKMAPTLTRKRLLAQVDRLLKILGKTGSSAFGEEVPESLLKDLAYYIVIADCKQPDSRKIKQLFRFDDIAYTEVVLQKEAISLTGPNANTVQSVAEVLRAELNQVKERMESFQQTEVDLSEYYGDIIPRTHKIKDALSVVGLSSAAEVLKEPLDQLEQSYKQDVQLAEDESSRMVDAFLYVESVLGSLEKRNFSDGQLKEINQLTQSEMISSNHLEDAQLVVIEEVEKGLGAIKQALTAFADSGYDNVHLEDISTTLDSVRGGTIVLSLPSATAIITNCINFIEKTLSSTEEPSVLGHMLETFADAIICLEYYFDCMKVDKNINENTLVIAEESLAALGYRIQ